MPSALSETCKCPATGQNPIECVSSKASIEFCYFHGVIFKGFLDFLGLAGHCLTHVEWRVQCPFLAFQTWFTDRHTKIVVASNSRQGLRYRHLF